MRCIFRTQFGQKIALAADAPPRIPLEKLTAKRGGERMEGKGTGVAPALAARSASEQNKHVISV